MKKISLLFNGVWSQYVFATAPKYRDLYELVYVHDLSYEAIASFAALVIPFQSNHEVIADKKDVIYRFLADGKKVACFGNSSPRWIDAQWEYRPTNNWWWKENPTKPPIAHTNFEHPLFKGLAPRHACWHTHGAYTRIPPHAEVLQTNADNEVISWQTTEYGGVLFAATVDPIVEHGVQQIQHLDHYCDNLTAWLCGIKPQGKLEIDRSRFGVAQVV